MIPKIIHYIWLGSAKKPELLQKCMQSWQKNCPDYQIMEWNSENTKDIDNIYFREALTSEKWAFASDYLRLYVLERYGGIYVDTDTEITNNLDPFLKHDFFTGYEIYDGLYFPRV